MTARRNTASPEVTPDQGVPVLVGLSEIVDLIPSRKPQTVYRWRLPRGDKSADMPPPLAIVARTPLWRLDTILDLIQEKGLAVDRKVLRRIVTAQGRDVADYQLPRKS